MLPPLPRCKLPHRFDPSPSPLPTAPPPSLPSSVGNTSINDMHYIETYTYTHHTGATLLLLKRCWHQSRQAAVTPLVDGASAECRRLVRAVGYDIVSISPPPAPSPTSHRLDIPPPAPVSLSPLFHTEIAIMYDILCLTQELAHRPK